MTAGGNSGLELVFAGAAGTTGVLECLDDVHSALVGNFTEDDVLAIQPGGHDCSNEELGAVARNHIKTCGSKQGIEHTCLDRHWPWTTDRAWYEPS